MAKSLVFNYTFNPSTRTIVVDGNVSLKRVLLISNVTRNVILFNFADPTKQITSRTYSSSDDETSFVLEQDCTGMLSTDDLQIFIEQDAVKFEPSETFTDPVSKIRVSQPNTLIDTDFEYGLQATKWETVERINEFPAFHPQLGDVALSNVIEVTVNGTKVVTVTTSSPHDLVTGVPIDVRGLDSITAEGTFIVKRVTDYSFTYETSVTQPGSLRAPISIFTSYVNITPGRFYVGSSIPLDNSANNTNGTIITDGATTLTATTPTHHGFVANSTFALVNTLSKTAINVNPLSVTFGGDIDDRSNIALSTGWFNALEPFHMGTVRRSVAQANVFTSNHSVSIPNHGLITGDPVAYVGVSAGGTRIAVNAVTGSYFNINANSLPTWSNVATDGFGMLFASVVDKDTVRFATNPRDAYENNTLITFNTSGAGIHEFALFQRGEDIANNITSISTFSGSSNVVVTLGGTNTTGNLGLFPSHQVTIANSNVASLNGVYVVTANNWSYAGNSFVLEGPTFTLGNLIPQSTTATYSLVDSGSNETTSFLRYNKISTTGFRAVKHDGREINHHRVSIHDWKAKNAKYWFRQQVRSDRIFIKNHGFANGQPLLYITEGNLWTGGTAPSADTVYFANVITRDEFEVYTTETGVGTGPYSVGTGSTKVNFSTSIPAAGGVYSFHPGFTINSFTPVSSGDGAGRDRVICRYNSIPGDVYHQAPIVFKSGGTLPTPLFNTANTLSTYQKYYVQQPQAANGYFEFSVSIAQNGRTVDFTGATSGANVHYGFIIDENQFSNSFYLVNHGGTSASQVVGGSGVQGTYPTGIDYPGPLFDLITDTTGRSWPRVRTTLTAAAPITGLSNGAQYYMVPVNSNVFKVQLYSVGTLPTGVPTQQIQNIVATSNMIFTNNFVQNPYGNRIILPKQKQTLVESALVKYENNGGTSIGPALANSSGLVNQDLYIVKNVTQDDLLTIPGTLSAANATTNFLTISTASGIEAGDYLKIGDEVVIVNGVVGNTLNVARGEYNTTASEVLEGSVVDKLYSTFQLFSNELTLPRQMSVAFSSTNASTDVWTFTNHGFRTAETVMVTAVSGSGSWAGTTGVIYYVIVVDENNFSLALSPALAYAQYPIDITGAGSSGNWTFTHFFNAIPLRGLSSSPVATHRLEDVSSTGTLDGNYTSSSVTSNTISLASSSVIPEREYLFDPSFQVNLTDGMFYIDNHGFPTGTKVRYSKNGATYAIGDSANAKPEGTVSLTDNTDYFVISKSLNVFQLAETKTKAIAGNAITRLAYLPDGIAHRLTSSQIAGDSIASGVATVVARDIVVSGANTSAILAASDRITAFAHGFNTGDRVVYQVWAGGTPINGLVPGRQYFVNNTVNPVVSQPGGAGINASLNQFSLHNTWVGAYTNTDRVDILGIGKGAVHQFKVTNPTLVGTRFKGEWNASDNYVFGDVVLYNNGYFMSVSGSAATGSFNTNRLPVNTSGRQDVSWMFMPTLPNYSTRFLTSFRGGDTVKISNDFVKRTIYFSGSGAPNTTNNTIGITNHGLTTGDAVIYRTDALGGSSQAGSSDYDGYSSSLPQAPIGGLTPGKVYYVNVVTPSVITLCASYSDAIRGGFADTGGYQFAVNLTNAGTGSYHRFDLIEPATYELNVLAVNSDREMVVSDPFTSRSIQFNPQGSFTTVGSLEVETVSITQDEFYIPSHGLLTGTKVYYSTGPISSGTAIGGLTDGATYYIIKTNDDAFRLATTLANAINMVPINLTSTGSGFQHYFIAATVAGSSFARYNTSGVNTSGTSFTGTTLFTSQNDSNTRDGVLFGLPMINQTQLFVRPDCLNLHRPFDGGVEMNASRSPGVSMVRQTRKYFRYQSGKGLQYSAGISFSPSIDVSRITHDGSTYATVVTRRPHKLTAGSKIVVENVIVSSGSAAPYTTPSSTAYFTVYDVINETTFRYATNGVPADLTPGGFVNLFVYEWTDAVVRCGMFDDQNGIFFEYDGQNLNCVRRNSTKQLGGAVNVVNKSSVFTGVNTVFTRQLSNNDLIVVRGMTYKVVQVVSDTVLHVTPPYRGTTRNGVVVTKTEDLRTPQTQWNIDKCDGTGPSGFNLNLNRMQMAYIDYSWYGAGKVRYGFKGPTGKVIYVHEYIHNNRETEAYMRSGNMPARYEVRNGNNPTYAPSIYHWGASIIMDGAFEDDRAYLFTVASGSGGSDTISIPQTLAGTPVPVLSIRLAPSVDSSLLGALGERDIINRMSVILAQVGLVVGNANNRPCSVRLILNGALSQSAYFTNLGVPSLMQVIKHTGQATDTITGGITIYEFRAAVNSPVTADLNELVELGNSVMGGDYVFPNGPDVLTVAVVPTDTVASSNVTARISWKESQA